MATSYYSQFGGGRGSTQDMLNKLEEDKAAANQYGEEAAGQRGEVYTPLPGVLNNPYGSSGDRYDGVRTSGGGSYGSGPTTGTGGIVTSPGSGGGAINLSRGSYEDQQAMQLKAKLANDAFARISGRFGSSGGTAPQVSYGGGDAATAARAAAFARAKEQAGQTAAAQLRTLQDVAGRRGIRGSTIEAGMIGDAVQGGAGDINEFTREQLLQDLQNTQHTADVSYQGGITQRGQDLSAQQALMSVLAGLY